MSGKSMGELTRTCLSPLQASQAEPRTRLPSLMGHTHTHKCTNTHAHKCTYLHTHAHTPLRNISFACVTLSRRRAHRHATLNSLHPALFPPPQRSSLLCLQKLDRKAPAGEKKLLYACALEAAHLSIHTHTHVSSRTFI